MTTTTIASVGLALILTATAATGAEARTRHRHPQNEIASTVFDRHSANPWATASIETRERKTTSRKVHRHVPHVPKPTGYPERRVAKHSHSHGGKSASLDHVTPRLAEKAREIIASCPGAKVISAYRPGARVRGYGTASLHARYPAEAIDMTGNTSCIYPRLKGWAGGYSVDYAAVQHVHISDASDRRERGARFSHYGTRRYASRHR